MNQLIPNKLLKLEEYHPTQNQYPIALDANESFLTLPPEVRAAILDKIITYNFCKYPDPLATQLCEAYGAYMNADPANIVAGNGSDELISVITSCLLEKGSRILCLDKDFSMYRFYGELCEEDCLSFPKEADFSVDFQKLQAYATEQAVDMVIFSNPCNPTGNVFDRAEVLNFVSSVDSLVVVDEAYMDFAEESIADCAEALPNLIVLRTCSKAFGLAAARLGFALTNPSLASALKKAKSPFNVNGLTQLIGEVVIGQRELIAQNIAQMKQNTKQLYDGLLALSQKRVQLETVYPTNTNFVYCKCPTAKIVARNLREEGISIRAYEDGYLRISTGSNLQNQKLLETLDKVLGKGDYVYEKIRAAKKNKGN